MKEVYDLKLDIPQNDFERYVTHAQFYEYRDLNIVGFLMKNEFMNYLKLMDGIQKKIRVRILNSKEYKVFIVFDFISHDVFFQTEVYECKEPITLTTCIGTDFHTEISRKTFAPEIIQTDFEKPTKLIIAMYYNDVLKLVEQETERFTNANGMITKLVAEYTEAVKKSQENIEKDVDNGKE